MDLAHVNHGHLNKLGIGRALWKTYDVQPINIQRNQDTPKSFIQDNAKSNRSKRTWRQHRPERYTCPAYWGKEGYFSLTENATQKYTHLRFSIHPITSRLNPSVFATSRIRLCVPLRIFRWSTRLSRTSLPCAKNSSSRVSVFWRNVCSSRARNSLLPIPGCGVDPRNGDSDTISLCGRRAGCSVEGPWECWNRRRVSEGDRGAADVADISSARLDSAIYSHVCWAHWGTQGQSGFHSLRWHFHPLVCQTDSVVQHSLFEIFALAY